MCMNLCLYTYGCILHTYECVCVYVCVCVCVYIYVHVYIYIWVYMCFFECDIQMDEVFCET